MSKAGVGAKRKRVKLVKITVDGVEVDAKACTKCGEVKALAGYNANGRGNTRSICRKCDNEYKRKYYKTNPEKKRDNYRKYRETNLEKIRERDRRYREYNHGKERERNRRYREANPEASRAKDHRRRAVKLELPSDWTTYHALTVLMEFNESCSLSQLPDVAHLDHVIPLAWGHGGSYVGNMIPLLSTLNISKSDEHFYEWFEANRQRFNLDQSRFDAVISTLAEQNGLTPDEYRQYVDWCFANKRSLDDIITDNKRYGYVVTSVELWREATGRPFPLRFDNREQTFISEESA